MKDLSITTDQRRGKIRQLLEHKKSLRILEAHNPISALLAENARVQKQGSAMLAYDGIWSSSLTDSTSRGLPDIEILSPSDRLRDINNIFDVSSVRFI